jgi:hypothetical protein
MSAIVEFQKKLLTDKQARENFAANPKKYLDDLGIKLPEGIDIPGSLDPALLEQQVAITSQNMVKEGINIDDIDRNDTNDVITAIENTVPALTKELVAAKGVHAALTATGRNPAEVATVAVVGAVVAAVVAVPVAVYGIASEAVRKINPAAGIEKISRGALGLTVHGPNGLRVEGLSVNEVAQLIKTIR